MKFQGCDQLTEAQDILEHHIGLGICLHKNLLVCKACLATDVTGLEYLWDELSGFRVMCFNGLTVHIEVRHGTWNLFIIICGSIIEVEGIWISKRCDMCNITMVAFRYQ